MLLGLDPLFYAETGYLIDQCIDLGLVFHCSPFEFLKMSEEQIRTLSERVAVRLKYMKHD